AEHPTHSGCAPAPTELHPGPVGILFADRRPQAIKTGWLGSGEVVQGVADFLSTHAPATPLVVDPVLVDGHGQMIVQPEVLEAYRQHLFPLAALVTPNRDEAALLLARPLNSPADLREAAQALQRGGARAVLVKGGHLADPVQVSDLFFDGEQNLELQAARLPIENARGVGCTYAAAIAARLAQGCSPGGRHSAAPTGMFNRRSQPGLAWGRVGRRCIMRWGAPAGRWLLGAFTTRA
ncbi:MAG: hypothetical protein HC915_21430, partial [Anaerolineae bacterium]|nr:hypothetical protein [Anaerolineae bacterium]